MDSELTVDQLLEGICSALPEQRTAAWTRAGEVGPAALAPLAAVLAGGALEVSRAAGHAMWKITRQASGPQAAERSATIAALVKLLEPSQPVDVRREVVWMISEVADEQAVPAVATLLTSKRLREDGRMVLERIPGEASIEALRAALQTAPDDFKYSLAQSLRKRGVAVQGYPCQKLIPTTATRAPAD